MKMDKNKWGIALLADGLRKHRRVAFMSLGLWLLSATCLVSCGESHHDHDGHEEHAEAEDEHHHADEIILEPEKAAAAGIETEKVELMDFHGVIHTSGTVMAASCDETTVVATTSGRIGQTGHISEGMHLDNGARLFTINSSDMLMADGDPVQHARIAYEQAQREFELAETLVKDQIISEKDYQLARSEYEAAKLTYESLRKNRSAGGVVVNAPRAGYVKQCLVNEGDYVEAGQPLMVITQNQHLYLRADVPERHWNDMNRITCAKFRTSYSDELYDITDMGGHVQSYAHASTSGSAYLPIIFEFNNTGNVVQGSYAEIFLITDESNHCITLPLTALTEEQGVFFVYVKVDEEGYRKQAVTLGLNDGERTEVTSGLEAGEEVVVKGALQVKLASATNAIPAHTHNH